MTLSQEIGKWKNVHATLGKKWHKEDADDEKEALTEEKVTQKYLMSYQINITKHFNTKSKE